MTDTNSSSKTNPALIYLQNPLREVTCKERRNLLGVSAFAIAIVKTGLIPLKISALGIEFSPAGRSALLSVLAVIVLYFWVAFIVYAISDYMYWKATLYLSIKDFVSQSRKEEIDSDVESIMKELNERYRYMPPKGWTKPVVVLKTLFEIALPIIVGLVAFYYLIFIPPSEAVHPPTNSAVPTEQVRPSTSQQ